MQKKALPLEVESLEERQFSGYGSIFGNKDLGDDIVVKGAFKRTLLQKKQEGRLPVMLWSHDPTRVAGKWLEMREDDRGLWVRGELAKTPLGDEVHELMKMDAVSGMSIGFVIMDHDYDKSGNRLIKEVDLWELSVCAMPMNPMARVQNVKTQTSAAGEFVPTPREFERILRDVGCSKAVAKRIIHKLFSDEVEAGETPVEARCDADEVELAAKRLRDIADQALADSILSRFNITSRRDKK